MKLYSARVRVGGSRDHEVDKQNLTAAEIHVLRHIHVSPQGHPSVVNIKHTGDVNRSDARERARLADLYTKGELTEDRGERIIRHLFGVPGVPLPVEYVEPEPVLVEDYDPAHEDEEVIVPVGSVPTPQSQPAKLEDMLA